MPIKPPPFVLHCSECRWRKTYAPKSDALVEFFPQHCPKCHSELKCAPLPAFSVLLHQFINRIS